MADVFYDPQQTYYGGSAGALDDQRKQSAQQMRLAQDLGNLSLGQGGTGSSFNPYASALTAGANLVSSGQRAVDAQNQTAVPIMGLGFGAESAASQFDPQAATRQAVQMAADQNARNAMSVARGGPYAAMGVRQALQMQGANAVQAQQQAGVLGGQMAQARAQLGIQGAAVAGQNAAAFNAARLQQQAQNRQFALAQMQGGISTVQQSAAQAAQMAQFRESLYSGRDMNVNGSQLQADQFYQQQQAQASQQKTAFVGGMVNAAGGVAGSAMGMGGGMGGGV